LATIVLLGITTYGVTKTLLAKRVIKCACLGTALDLPMTEATFIENAIMIVMSVIMLGEILCKLTDRRMGKRGNILINSKKIET